MTTQEIIEGLTNILNYCRYHENAPALREAIRILTEMDKAEDDLSSAEPEIIWCKDCVHHIDGFFCRQANHHTSDKDHCASVFRAERREE